MKLWEVKAVLAKGTDYTIFIRGDRGDIIGMVEYDSIGRYDDYSVFEIEALEPDYMDIIIAR